MNYISRTFLSRLLALFILLSLTGCGSQRGITGHIGERLKGKTLSVEISLLGSNMTSYIDLAIRNESETEVLISPVRVVAWFGLFRKKDWGELDLKPPTLFSKTEFTVPPVFSYRFGRPLKKIRVFLGPKGPKQEIFTATWGKATAKGAKEEIKQEVTEKETSKIDTSGSVQDQPAVKPGRLNSPVEIPEETTGEELSEMGVEGGVMGGVVGEVEAPIRVIGDIKPPRLLIRVEPIYPETARQARVEGLVILEVTTDVYGKVKDLKLLRSIPLLDQSAIDAVRQWVYEPILINGKPRGVIFQVTIRFQLK